MKEKQTMKFYKVKAMFGHVGEGRYYAIEVPCVAISEEAAIYKVSHKVGGVKHDRAESIMRIQEVSYNEYKEIRENYSKNPYVISKRNCINRSELKNQIKDSIKKLPRTSHQSNDCKESRIGFKQHKYQSAIERAEEDIRAYMY